MREALPGGAAAARALRGAHGGGAGRAGRDAAGEQGRGPTASRRWCRVRADGALPLSFAQQRLWFLDQLEPGSAVVQHPRGAAAGGRAGRGARWSGALQELVRRHEALRTTFAEVDGQPVQVIAPAAELRAAGGWTCAGCRRPSGRRGAAAGDEEARAPVRSGAGPAAARRAAAAGRARARAAADDAPHRLRRLVAGRARPRAGGAVRGLRRRASRRRCRRCRSSTRTTRCGSASGCRARCWRRSWRTGSEQLAGAPPLLELPTDQPASAGADLPGRARMPVQLCRGAVRSAAGAEPARRA